MRVGFDISQTGPGRTGCGYVSHSLITAFAQHPRGNEFVLYPVFGSGFWDRHWRTGTYRHPTGRFPRLLWPASWEDSRRFWNTPAADFESQLGNPDLVHSNNFFCPIGLRRARLVYTLHDVLVLDHPEWTGAANHWTCFQGVHRASLHADLVLAVSAFSRSRFLSLFPHYPPERIQVVHLASRFSGRPQATHSGLAGPPAPGGFLLASSAPGPRKNLARLLRAYLGLRARLPHAPPLLLAGPEIDQHDAEIHSLVRDAQVRCLGYVDDNALQWLYENCLVFLFPSLGEGFGLPVLEAMSLGAAVVAGNNTCLPEVVGSAAVLVDALDETALGAAIEALLADPPRLNQLRREARARAQDFSWRSTAARVAEFYELALSLPRFSSAIGATA